MKITFDRHADAVYIKLNKVSRHLKTLEIANNVVVDINEDGNLVGIEVLQASKVIDLSELVVKDITNI